MEGFDEVEVEAHSEVRNGKCSEQEQEQKTKFVFKRREHERKGKMGEFAYCLGGVAAKYPYQQRVLEGLSSQTSS